jgi:hypothetical protein
MNLKKVKHKKMQKKKDKFCMKLSKKIKPKKKFLEKKVKVFLV